MTAQPPTLQALLDRLDVPEDRVSLPSEEADRPPWYLWAMSALGACIAGGMLLWVMFPILSLLGLLDALAGFGVGVIIVAAAIALNRKLLHRNPLFIHTLALVLAIGGGALITASVAESFQTPWAVPVILWLLTIVGFPALRAPMLGFVGVLAAMGTTLAVLLTSGASDLAMLPIAVAAVVIASAAMLLPPAGFLATDLRPAAMALLAAPLPVLQHYDILSPTSVLGAAPYAIAALAILWRRMGMHAWLLSTLPVAGMSLLSPGAAGALLFLALAHVLGNRLLAVLGVVGLIAAVGHLYYVIDLTLLAKAGILAACGLLTLAAWRASGTDGRVPSLGRPASRRRGVQAVAGILAGLILIPAFVGWRVVVNERILSDGREIHVALAPLDPRSLIQGDYMDLRLDDRLLPPSQTVDTLPRRGILVVIVDEETREARGVRLYEDGAAPKPDEHLLAYRIRKGRLVVGADSFLFQESTADLHEGATHGILRVAADGTALLTGLR